MVDISLFGLTRSLAIATIHNATAVLLLAGLTVAATIFAFEFVRAGVAVGFHNSIIT